MSYLTRRVLLVALGLSAALLLPSIASADFIVMTDKDTANATINGAIYSVGSAGSGTGIFPSFVRIQDSPTEEGYNTTVNNVLDNTSDDTHNYEIQAGNIAVTTIGGKQYFVFQVDLNESAGGNPDNGYISLDSLKIYTSNIPNQSVTDPDDLGTLRYNMDAGTDNTILLDYKLFPGSGKSDLVVFIPVWDPIAVGDYVYLYSAFGGAGVIVAGTYTGNLTGGGTYTNPEGDYGTSDGFEEWAFNLGGEPLSPVPAPASLLLAATGILGLGLARFRRMVRRGPLAA